jgi:hypothetical protein
VQRVREGKLSFRDAEAESGISRSKLQRLVAGTQQIGALQGPGTAISAEGEAHLLVHIAVMRRHARSMTVVDVCAQAATIEAAEAAAAGRQPKWPKGAASRKWWEGFAARHGTALRSAQVGEADRLAAAVTTVVYPYFEELNRVICKYGIPPHRIFNWDETGVSDGGRWPKAVAEGPGVRSVQRVQGNGPCCGR